MRILNCQATNFGSYKELEFNFEDLGLSLIYGATGSGKSTIQDLVCWALFGITAKNGSVDDVCNWQYDSDPTTVHIQVDVEGNIIGIFRARGKGQNDLYFIEYGARTEATLPSDELRGKDITETQVLLDKRLGVSAQLYVTGAYFSEFSPTGNFFMAKSSDRRKILEEIANLEFVTTLGRKFKEEKTNIRAHLNQLQFKVSKIEGRLEQVFHDIDNLTPLINSWQKKHDHKANELSIRIKNFDSEKETKIQYLKQAADAFDDSYLCPTCGKLSDDKKRSNPYLDEIERTKREVNSYQERLIDHLKETNTCKDQQKVSLKLADEIKNQLDNVKEDQKDKQYTISQLDVLFDLSLDLKSILLQDAINMIQTHTNDYLERFFDSELRVEFDISKADKIDILIRKNGYECSYKQLSKGQRGLLKLCFSISVMKSASNRSGVHFENLFFDEALDGLDTELKIKSFALFQELEKNHNSIMLIDHCDEFKNLFDRKFHVTIEDETSNIEEII